MATTKSTTAKKPATTKTATKPVAKKTAVATTKVATKKVTAKTATAKKPATTVSKTATPAAAKKPAAAAKAAPGKTLTPEQRYRMVQDAAYFIAEKNGFVKGSMDY
jgi:hypothetical protein